jgi:3,4-dihydroxy-2-butanone 4-phosphate synthase/GTP cyclohydrolase II
MTGARQAETVRRVASTRLPTRWGEFRLLGYERVVYNCTRRVDTALALVAGEVTTSAPLVRIHSQCLTGEVLGSLRCDCSDQLELAIHAIADEGRGVLIYEHQEGRGIGLMAKLRAYALQDVGLDTIEANRALGYKADCRDFALPAAILRELGVGSVRLLSNNPAKAQALCDAGIEVISRVACEVEPNPHSSAYLRTKKERMGHMLSLPRFDAAHTIGRRTASGDESTDRTGGTPRGRFASIGQAIGELRAGRMIVVVDDRDREDEGDLVAAADLITPEAVNFMATHGRGLICLAMTGERLDALDLAPMAPPETALGGTAFAVSIDVKGGGATTGISAYDRARTIRAAVDARSSPEDFARPGHVFPLRARPGGVLERRGHTEAAVDLASLAGLSPAGVICEIVNDDGTMARVPDLVRFCRRHNLVMVTVADLARFRMESAEEGSLGAIDELLPGRLGDSAVPAGDAWSDTEPFASFA